MEQHLGTQAAAGWAGGRAHYCCRPPEGRAGGLGLDFNGGELLALAIGGCFRNGLQYVAHELGMKLATISVDVTVTLEGDPLIATSAVMAVVATAVDDADIVLVILSARETSTVSNWLARGIKVETVISAQGERRLMLSVVRVRFIWAKGVNDT